ncbi:MAG: SMC-Scp complex subunit ScpB [Treponema sp.]|jgi:segregation and condensation protein B|nr:SMC-Scp complex subunit ScpB [Treponema sp.]
MEVSLEKETALVEAILYLEADPLDEAVISRISGLSRDVVAKALENLGERYAQEVSGVELSRIGGGVMISPKKEYWDNLRERYGKKNESKLSKAALETLSIIAYKQPITRSEIEQIRGVQADTMIRLLLEKNLVRETGKKDAPGRPIQYGTTRDFLKFFRLESISDLPKLNEMENDRFELTGDE